MKEIKVDQNTWPVADVRSLEANRAQGVEGNDVRNLLPPTFDAYLKIFDFLYDQSKSPAERVSWKLATEMASLEFTPELGYWSFHRPGSHIWNWPEDFHPDRSDRPTSGLCLETAEALVEVLRPFTGQQECYFYFDDWKTWCGPKCFSGPLEEFSLFYTQSLLASPYQTPTYIWPEDRGWCFNSDDDLEFVVLGCSKDLAAKILSSAELESIEVQLTTRIDAKADVVNLTKDVPQIYQPVWEQEVDYDAIDKATEEEPNNQINLPPN